MIPNLDFIKTIINGLKCYIDANKPEIATDEEIIDMFIEEDILPAVKDSDGSILTDEHGNILLW
jgi:hypothetical protein